jgi:hypothetical protein
MPYGKFAHAIYRSAALVKYALDAHGRSPVTDRRSPKIR